VSDHFWEGMAIILLGGLSNGSFALPMKSSRAWHWENTWLVFSLISLLLLPVVLAFGFVPELPEVYRSVPARSLTYPLAFGFFWGIAQLTFGLGIKAVGMGLAMAVVAGLSCLTGSLVPLLIFNPADLIHPRGLLLIISMPILFVGLGLYGKAGMRREKEQSVTDSPVHPADGRFASGLAICIFTGVVGSSINLGFAFSGSLIQRSLQLGGTPVTSTYAVWPLVLGAGLVPNLFYCFHSLSRNRTWPLMVRAGWPREVGISTSMGLLWLAGIVAYGIGARRAGTYGTSLGFAVFTAAQILSANTLGVLTGEWASTSMKTRRLLAAGTVVTLVSVGVLNLGGVL